MALAAQAEVFIVGLAAGSITYRADATSGNFADGISIWTGFGADTIRVDGTHKRAGMREITWLNTGLGNDNVTVSLAAATEGFFVLDTQGAYDDVLHLATDIVSPVRESATFGSPVPEASSLIISV